MLKSDVYRGRLPGGFPAGVPPLGRRVFWSINM